MLKTRAIRSDLLIMRQALATGGRWLKVIGLVGLMSAVLTGCLSAEQRQVSDLVNRTRIQSGVGELREHDQLRVKAQVWAERLAAEGGLRHSLLQDGVTAPWRALGENVGVGASVDSVHGAFMASPQHRANILDRRYTNVGTGVAKANGRVYVVQVFMQL